MSLPTSARMSICRANITNNIRTGKKFSNMPQIVQAPIIFVDNSTPRRTNQLLGSEKFPFPGDVAVADDFLNTKLPVTEKVNIEKVEKPSEPLYQTISVDKLINASMDIKYSHDYKPVPIIDELNSDCNVELNAIACPKLLKKDLKYLFVDKDLRNQDVTVLNLTQKSETDQAAWSPDMEIERMKLTASFIDSATAICQALKENGYWADFIDPSSGRPYLGKYTNASLFETDERYRQLGFQIEDLGCCKVTKHMLWGTHSFVGTIFTDAPLDSDFVKQVLKTVNNESECV